VSLLLYKVTTDFERLSRANGRSDIFVNPEGVIEFSSSPKYENVVISVFIEGKCASSQLFSFYSTPSSCFCLCKSFLYMVNKLLQEMKERLKNLFSFNLKINFQLSIHSLLFLPVSYDVLSLRHVVFFIPEFYPL